MMPIVRGCWTMLGSWMFSLFTSIQKHPSWLGVAIVEASVGSPTFLQKTNGPGPFPRNSGVQRAAASMRPHARLPKECRGAAELRYP